MSFAAGMRLGPYEIIGLIGAGGMGHVYKARDTRLDRTVAIKVLPPNFTAPEDRARFEREARTIAALSHPHICTLHDVGEHENALFLVMEHLDGDTLAQRLERGSLPLDQALTIGAQIADALAAAHRQGITHRDLKPGNIMLTRSGARLLDFGIARLARTPSSDLTNSAGLTGHGMILGTLQYMAPEQLNGQAIDQRVDIFALGAVLYEMVTRRKAFEGETEASVFASILRDKPAPMANVLPTVPLAFERAVNKCLRKDPEMRWQDARDLADELRWIADSASEAGAPSTGTPRAKPLLLSWMVVGIGAAALLTLGAVVYLRDGVPEKSRVVFSVARPPTSVPFLSPPELSPDGKQLLVPGLASDGRTVLWVRTLDALTLKPLAGTADQNPQQPFWSPDGQSVGFFAGGMLKTIPVSGGAAQTLAEAPDPAGGSWNSQGTILFVPRRGPLFQVPSAGGQARPLLALDTSRREISHSSPRFLPDGRHFLYEVASADPGSSGVYIGSLDRDAPRILLRSASLATFSPPGYILFLREQTLFAQPFDLRRLQFTGDAFPVPGPDGEAIATYGGRLFSASQTGDLAYVGNRLRDVRLSWRDRSGKLLGTIGTAGSYAALALSPDGKRLAVERADPKSWGAVWVLDVASGVATRITFGDSPAGEPAWSPDSLQVAHTVFRRETADIYRTVIGKGDPELLFESDESKYPEEWSRDGTSILFIDQNGKSLYTLPLSGGSKPLRLLQTPFDKDGFHVSPNGQWITYSSLESGQWEIYTASFPAFANKRQISSGGGCQALWRKDGKQLFYLDLHGMLRAVDVVAGTVLQVGLPRSLFQTPLIVNPVIRQYAVTGDGQRFILAEAVGEEEPVTVILNWAAGLKR